MLGDVEIERSALTAAAGGTQSEVGVGSGAGGGAGAGGGMQLASAGGTESSAEGNPALDGLGSECEPGSVQCTGAALQLCSPDGRRWITTDICGSPALCNTAPPGCQPPVCGLDQVSCEGAVLQTCNATRDGWVRLDTCASAAHCSPDARQCLAAPCAVGDLACNRRELQQCADNQLGWVSLDACATQELCELARTGGAESCAEPMCEAGATRCAGATLERCNEGLTAWEPAEECRNPALCELSLANGSAVCEAPRCEPGERRCAEETLSVCNADQTGFDDAVNCQTAALCDPGSSSCRAAACVPGARRCNGALIETCREDRTGFERAGDPACASPRLCIQNPNNDVFCRPPVCSEGQFRCAGDGLLQRCNAGRDAWEDVRRCDTPQLCDAALGPQGCRASVCQAGEQRCEANSVVECRAGRDGFDKVAECGAAGCDLARGACLDPCLIGRPRCNGAALEECSDPLQGWQVLDTCSDSEICDAGARQCRPVTCTPGQRQCTAQGEIFVCNASQSGFVLQTPPVTCESPQLCDVTTPTGCLTATCAPDQRRCAGARLEACNDARTGFNLLEMCASAALCTQNGAGDVFQCDAPACNAGETQCLDSRTLGVCNPDLSGFDTSACGILGCDAAANPPECRTLFGFL
jgi:hypothetical protein